MKLMKRLAFIFITCSACLLAACHRQDEQSKALEKYLLEEHQLRINDSTLYCFFPSNQCKNCFRYSAMYVMPETNAHTVIITGFDSSNFKGFRHVLHDGSDAMLGLTALDYGNRIISLEDGNIKTCVAVNDLYAQLDSTWLQLKTTQK